MAYTVQSIARAVIGSNINVFHWNVLRVHKADTFFMLTDNDAATADTVVPEEPEKVSSEWWAEFVKSEDQFKTELSGKLLILADILKMCESIGDKV